MRTDTYTMKDGPTVTRMGYGAMQLAGPHVWGPPRDRDEAIRVLRTAVELGITHIDTSDFYGPHVTNDIIREALHPYPDDLVIVTKVGAVRGPEGTWDKAMSRDELISAVHDNLRNLGLDALDVVNLRMMDGDDRPEDVVEPLGVLAELREQGLIRHLGVSTVTAAQFDQARAISPIVCVQNHYNVAHRVDDALLERCADLGVAFVPYFPLGGFSPLQSDVLDRVAERVGSTPLQVSLAWLWQRAENVLLIPGTSSLAHLHDNVAAAELELPADALAELDAVSR